MCKNKTDKVFSERIKINQILDKLNYENVTYLEIGKAINKLSKFESKNVNDTLLKRLHGSDNEFYVSSYILREIADESVSKDILELIFQKKLNDEKKAILVSLLDEMNVPLENIDFNSAFQDVEKMGKMAIEGLLQEIETNNKTLDRAVEWIYEIPEDARYSFIDSICENKSDKAFSFLEKMLLSNDKELVKRILNNLSKSSEPLAITTIKNALEYINDTEIKELSERTLRKLSFKGIEEVKTKKTKKSKLGDIYKILITNLDGVGSQSLWIARNSGKQLNCLFLLLNEKIGIKDCFGNKMSKKDFDQMTGHQSTNGITVAEISYEKAIKYIKDGLYTSEKNGSKISPAFNFLRTDILEEKLIESQEYKPEFDDYNLEKIRDDNTLFEMSEMLQDILPECESWFIVNKLTYNIAEELLKKSKNKNITVPSKKQVKTYAKDILGDLVPFLKRRLILTADLLDSNITKPIKKKKDRELKKSVELLLHVAQSIEHGKVENNSFLLALVEDSIYQAQISLLNGFDFRQNPEYFN